MKPSHLQTPRTLNECIFTPGYGRADVQPSYSLADRAVLWASALAALALVLIVAFVPEVKA